MNRPLHLRAEKDRIARLGQAKQAMEACAAERLLEAGGKKAT
jgi:hypothetical protein